MALEATVWPLDRKRALVEALDRDLPDEAILASLATAHCTTEIASWTTRADRLVGFGSLAGRRPPWAGRDRAGANDRGVGHRRG